MTSMTNIEIFDCLSSIDTLPCEVLTSFLHGKMATHLKCSGILNDRSIANVPLGMLVKEF